MSGDNTCLCYKYDIEKSSVDNISLISMTSHWLRNLRTNFFDN